MNDEHPDFDYTPEGCAAFCHYWLSGRTMSMKTLEVEWYVPDEPVAVEEVTQDD